MYRLVEVVSHLSISILWFQVFSSPYDDVFVCESSKSQVRVIAIEPRDITLKTHSYSLKAGAHYRYN